MGCLNVELIRTQRARLHKRKRLSVTAVRLGCAGVNAVDVIRAVYARNAVSRNAAHELDEDDARRVGAAALPMEGDVIPACYRLPLVNQEQSIGQAGRQVQAQAVMLLPPYRASDNHKVDVPAFTP